MSCYDTPTWSEGTNIIVENQKFVLSIASYNYRVFQINVYNFKTIFWTSEDLPEANIVFIAFLKRVQFV